ncbi:MAG: hypothetical protein H6701_05855 [Myxococcales bacterium]|nr:hypothetical protein [Myxococcales bacterium]
MTSPARIGLAALVAVALALFGAWWPGGAPDRAALIALSTTLEAHVVARWRADGLRRADGCAYTVDLGHLLLHAARAGDRALYDAVAPGVRALVRDDPSDPYTRGFVPWRRCVDRPDDASGTTEALRVAKALWTGAARFALPDDRALALRVLDGYGRHAAVEYGVWMVRNYFAFETRAFANDSYLVDYDPDFVAAVARETGDPALAALADRSARLVEQATAPSGLIHTLVQPDVATLLPEAPIPVFSPNDVIQVNNACTVAEVSVATAPRAARGVYVFARRQGRDLRRAYLGRSGVAVDETRAEVTAWSCLARLAAALGEADRVTPRAVRHWRWLANDPDADPYAVADALLALDVLLADR